MATFELEPTRRGAGKEAVVSAGAGPVPCGDCGYDLRSSPTENGLVRCPECGAMATRVSLLFKTHSRPEPTPFVAFLGWAPLVAWPILVFAGCDWATPAALAALYVWACSARRSAGDGWWAVSAVVPLFGRCVAGGAVLAAVGALAASVSGLFAWICRG